MFDTTLEELEEEVKDCRRNYKDDLEEVERANEYLLKSSERYFTAQIELLKFKLKNIK